MEPVIEFKMNDNQVFNDLTALIKNGTVTPDSIIFNHFRKRDKHHRVTDLKGGVTIVSIYSTKAGLIVAKADCSKDDNFSKITGRTVAVRRAIENIEKKTKNLTT